jgi:uncharacterized membrane protein HdeD (DUF308 family)
MRVREFFIWQAGEYDFLWKSQLFLGAMLVVTGIVIVLFPAFLVALVAVGIIMAGASLIGSAWRMRRLQRHSRDLYEVESLEW